MMSVDLAQLYKANDMSVKDVAVREDYLSGLLQVIPVMSVEVQE